MAFTGAANRAIPPFRLVPIMRIMSLRVGDPSLSWPYGPHGTDVPPGRVSA